MTRTHRLVCAALLLIVAAIWTTGLKAQYPGLTEWELWQYKWAEHLWILALVLFSAWLTWKGE